MDRRLQERRIISSSSRQSSCAALVVRCASQSARLCGRAERIAATQPERQRLLFDRLAGVPRPWHARFVCVLALTAPGWPTCLFTGTVDGQVVERRGGTTGFGYDPVFLIPEVGLTFAQMAPAEKHRWSHRAATVRALLESGALSTL